MDNLCNSFLLRYSVISYVRAGRLISITDQEGAVTSYQYDTQGNMTAVMDALGQTNRMEYDACGRLIHLTQPDGGVKAISMIAAAV